jgi:hypothetical protein
LQKSGLFFVFRHLPSVATRMTAASGKIEADAPAPFGPMNRSHP